MYGTIRMHQEREYPVRVSGTALHNPDFCALAQAYGYAAERVAETLMRAFRALQREPHLADAMVRALTFADRSVSPEVDTVSRQTTAIILDAMGLDRPTPEQLSAVRVIEHTWHSALITWLSGRASIAQVKIDIETVCRLIDLTGGDRDGA